MDGWTYRSNESSDMPRLAAASSRVSAVRGIGAVSAIAEFGGVEGGFDAADEAGVAVTDGALAATR
jgi:hypothetical protein